MLLVPLLEMRHFILLLLIKLRLRIVPRLLYPNNSILPIGLNNFRALLNATNLLTNLTQIFYKIFLFDHHSFLNFRILNLLRFDLFSSFQLPWIYLIEKFFLLFFQIIERFKILFILELRLCDQIIPFNLINYCWAWSLVKLPLFVSRLQSLVAVRQHWDVRVLGFC